MPQGKGLISELKSLLHFRLPAARNIRIIFEQILITKLISTHYNKGNKPMWLIYFNLCQTLSKT